MLVATYHKGRELVHFLCSWFMWNAFTIPSVIVSLWVESTAVCVVKSWLSLALPAVIGHHRGAWVIFQGASVRSSIAPFQGDGARLEIYILGHCMIVWDTPGILWHHKQDWWSFSKPFCDANIRTGTCKCKMDVHRNFCLSQVFLKLSNIILLPQLTVLFVSLSIAAKRFTLLPVLVYMQQPEAKSIGKWKEQEK